MKIFGRTQKSLLAVQIFKVALEIFTNTFLTSYIVSLNQDNIFGSGLLNIGLLFISQYAVYITLYFLISYFVKKSKRTNFLRLGVLINTCLIVIFVFFGKQLSSWVMLAGAMIGCADAFYYSSYLVLKNELNSRANMYNYNLFATILGNLTKVVIPVILGYVIDLFSYSYIAIYVVILGLVQFGLTFLVKTTNITNSKFELKKYSLFLKEDEKARGELKYTYWNAILAGGKNTYKIIVVVLTVMIFKTNFSLGILTSIFSLITIGFLFLFKYVDKKSKINMFWVYFITGLLPLLTCIILLCFFNEVTLIIYNFVLTFALCMSDYLGSLERDSIIKNVGKREYIAEHQFFVELFQNIGRIVSYALFICVSLFASMLAFEILFCFLISLSPIKFLVMHKQRKIRLQYDRLNAEKQETSDGK